MIRQARHQTLRWSTFRAANGLLSERRALVEEARKRKRQNVCVKEFSVPVYSASSGYPPLVRYPRSSGVSDSSGCPLLVR